MALPHQCRDRTISPHKRVPAEFRPLFAPKPCKRAKGAASSAGGDDGEEPMVMVDLTADEPVVVDVEVEEAETSAAMKESPDPTCLVRVKAEAEPAPPSQELPPSHGEHAEEGVDQARESASPPPVQQSLTSVEGRVDKMDDPDSIATSSSSQHDGEAPDADYSLPIENSDFLGGEEGLRCLNEAVRERMIRGHRRLSIKTRVEAKSWVSLGDIISQAGGGLPSVESLELDPYFPDKCDCAECCPFRPIAFTAAAISSLFRPAHFMHLTELRLQCDGLMLPYLAEALEAREQAGCPMLKAASFDIRPRGQADYWRETDIHDISGNYKRLFSSPALRALHSLELCFVDLKSAEDRALWEGIAEMKAPELLALSLKSQRDPFGACRDVQSPWHGSRPRPPVPVPGTMHPDQGSCQHLSHLDNQWGASRSVQAHTTGHHQLRWQTVAK